MRLANLVVGLAAVGAAGHVADSNMSMLVGVPVFIALTVLAIFNLAFAFVGRK